MNIEEILTPEGFKRVQDLLSFADTHNVVVSIEPSATCEDGFMQFSDNYNAKVVYSSNMQPAQIECVILHELLHK